MIPTAQQGLQVHPRTPAVGSGAAHPVPGRGAPFPLGVIFYELLAGQRPFDAQTSNAIMRQHLNMKPPPLRERAPGVSESLCRLVHDMLAKEGAKRPSMAEVQERLTASERSKAGRQLRYVLFALAVVVPAAGLFGWHHGKRQAMPAATLPTSGMPVAAPLPASGPPVVAAGQPAGALPAPAAGAAPGTPSAGIPASAAAAPPAGAPAPLAAAPAAAVSPAALAAAPPAAAAPAADAAAGGRGGVSAAASRASRRRASRESGRHEQPAAAPPATGSGVLKAIDFGKH